MAISNVPFGDYAVRDARYRPMSIHDYFFVRSLDKIRPGGLIAFITSRYSLDKETDLARREIARRADFLGAIRLPGGKDGAFAGNAGTEVTTGPHGALIDRTGPLEIAAGREKPQKWSAKGQPADSHP